MEKTKRVAIYARVSTADQTTENQMLDLRRFCAARGWTIIEEFIDHGISGAKEDRPALRRLMDSARRRKVDCVLVWRFDRFARSLSHLVNALREFRELHIDFASNQEGIDTTTSHGRMVFGILASLAEFERDLIRDRIHAGLRRAKAQGKRFGRPSISESQVASIMAERGKGSTRQIATRLGISKSVVQRVLSRNGIQKVAFTIDETPVTF